jgi:hypothetical protein
MERTVLQHGGQHLFVGLDGARKSWKVSIIGEVLEHKTFTQLPSVDVLTQYLKHNFPGARVHCAYEAGFSGYGLYEQLREQQIDCLVVNPADVPFRTPPRLPRDDGVSAGVSDGVGIVLVVRTVLEDRLLLRALPGYGDYAAMTRWRLLRGVFQPAARRQRIPEIYPF